MRHKILPIWPLEPLFSSTRSLCTVSKGIKFQECLQSPKSSTIEYNFSILKTAALPKLKRSHLLSSSIPAIVVSGPFSGGVKWRDISRVRAPHINHVFSVFSTDSPTNLHTNRGTAKKRRTRSYSVYTDGCTSIIIDEIRDMTDRRLCTSFSGKKNTARRVCVQRFARV